MLSCVCVLAVFAPILVVGQYQQYSGQPYPGQPAQPAQQDYNQPLTATNYQTDGHQRSESVDGQGNVKGQYSYVDPNGKTITIKYSAGKDGFQVEGDHLPQSPAVPPAGSPQPQQYQSQYQPQQYQPQAYQPQQQYQSQPQYQPQVYQHQQQYQPQQYQPQPQTQYPQQYQSQPQQYQQQSQSSFQLQGFPQNRFGSPQIPAGVSVSQNPNGGFTYSYSPTPTN